METQGTICNKKWGMSKYTIKLYPGRWTENQTPDPATLVGSSSTELHFVHVPKLIYTVQNPLIPKLM